MSFRKLQDSLIEAVRNRVRNGEITERHLAKITGVSQPHIHNVLKGVRELSPGLSDRVLLEFHLSVRDLMVDAAKTGSEIPIVQDLLGSGYPFPRECYRGVHPFCRETIEGLIHPVVFRLARDQPMEPDLLEHDLVLVDRSQQVRCNPNDHSLYLVEFAGCGLVRYIREERAEIRLATARTLQAPEQWQRADLGARDILELIRGRIVWIARQMETPPGSADQTGRAAGPSGGTGRKDRGRDVEGRLGTAPRSPDPARDLRGLHPPSEFRDDPDGDATHAGSVRSGDVPRGCAEPDSDESARPHRPDSIRGAGTGDRDRKLPASVHSSWRGKRFQSDAA